MTRIRLILQYDGSSYHGFQKQENAISIQEILETSITNLTGEKVSVICAGRTDAGVHALGQVVAFNTSASIPGDRWKMAINSFLPEDVQVVQSCTVRPEFNPRFDAISKEYIYLIYRHDTGRVHYRNYALCSREKLSLSAMQEAARLLVGRHNFKAFCASGSSAHTFERILMRCSLEERRPFIEMRVEADGFLYNMVRIIMGTLLEVGKGKYPPQWVAEVLASQNRSQAGPTALPNGLYLARVKYPEEN